MRLPYMDNATAILLTMAINLAIMLAINWGKRFGLADVLLDAAICGVTTAVINVFFVRRFGTEIIQGIRQACGASIPVVVDWIVLALGVRPRQAVNERFKNSFEHICIIGDARCCGRILEATQDAHGKASVAQPSGV